MDWKERVTSVSDKVFPGLSHKVDKENIENEVMSNLPLQMALYFNVVFAPFWFCVMVIFLNYKYNCYTELYKFISVTVMVMVVVVELLRLYLGYEGNLRDKIPELASFWLLSLFLQFPLQGALLFNPYFKQDVIEVIVQAVMFLLLSIQLIAGYIALKNTSTKQAIYYKILKLRRNVSSSDFDNKFKEN